MLILTHRGLDPSIKSFYTESSFGAFSNHLKRGFGIEFDVQFAEDNIPIVFHNKLKDLSFSEIKQTRIGNKDRICSLKELLHLINRYKNKRISALHLKSNWQKDSYLNILISEIKDSGIDFKKFLIFDVKINTAKYLKKRLPAVNLAPSVSHQYDIERYSRRVGGTLTDIKTAINNRGLFSWVWLDEWDLDDKSGDVKQLYTRENFGILRSNGFRMAVVSPELHATSPGLLGNEFHQDAVNQTRLFKRIAEIINLRPDAICTDYPDKVRNFLKKQSV